MRSRMTLVMVLCAVLAIPFIKAEENSMIIALIGDSTVTATAGWGAALSKRFDDRVKILNFSQSGRSSKSFYDEERLPPVLAAKPDYMLIQFGHNGQPGKGEYRETDPATTYRDYLRIYVNKSRVVGAIPIIISPVTRRVFDEQGKIKSTLTPWAEAAKAVAAEMKVQFIDLHSSSIKYHNNLGKQKSMTFNLKEGDLTHLNQKGAETIADLIVQELRKIDQDLALYLK